MTTTLQAPDSRAKRLKAATSDAHDSLDKRIMAADPFAAIANYGRFLHMQYRFHREIEALYDDARLHTLLPDLAERRRLELIGQDMRDLGLPLPEPKEDPVFGSEPADLPTALGWLYVAEGSNLGAAFLFKMARALGLNETHGARHLAGHPDGRAQHWRTFTAALDAVSLNEAEEDRLADGASTAFRRVRALVKEGEAAA